MPEEVDQGISRRDLLKRGAALGGAVVWMTPLVQTVGMGPAFAETVSPGIVEDDCDDDDGDDCDDDGGEDDGGEED